jgi:hypothetical protein
MGLYSFSFLLITVILYSLFGLGIYRFFITLKSFKEGITVFFANLIAFLLIYPTGNLILWFIVSAVIIPITLGLIFKSFTKWSLIKYIAIILLFLIGYLIYKGL